MYQEPGAITTGNKYVNKKWTELEPLLVHTIHTNYPEEKGPNYSPMDMLKSLIQHAFDRGRDAAQAGTPESKNPFQVIGLSPYGEAVALAWAAGHLAGEQSK